jgi:hypothetical protein
LALSAAGCSPTPAEDEPAQAGALRPAERVAVGAAAEYEADSSLGAQSARLDTSMQRRRAAAWQAVLRALKPVALAEREVRVGERAPTLPAFRTWYHRDDIERLFGAMYSSAGVERRKARRPFSESETRDGFASLAKDRGSWTEDAYFARVRQVGDDEQAQGLGGNARMSYSPAFVTHLFGQYGSLYGCLPRLSSIDGSTEPRGPNHAPCMTSEFPAAAAVIKAKWLRADFGWQVPVYDTDGASLQARMAGTLDDGGWGRGAREANPDPASIYTVKMSNGDVHRLAGLHLVTKELKHWLWISLWWSDRPNEDFGEDRPKEIDELGGPWKNYKMCVVTNYDDGQDDPTGGFGGSLGAALQATHGGKGGPSWCSNPYIERGPRNAQTNCVGCHQHAGAPKVGTEEVLGDETAFPKAGRTRIRKNFPFDYVFALDARPDQLIRGFQGQIEQFDSVDR